MISFGDLSALYQVHAIRCGVSPSWFLAFMFSPIETKYFTTSVLPNNDAK